MSVNKPRDRPTVPEVLPLVRELYRESEAGGPLHIVLDDGNISDEYVQWCINEAIPQYGENWHATPDPVRDLCYRIAAMMLQMTTTQRRKLVSLSYE